MDLVIKDNSRKKKKTVDKELKDKQISPKHKDRETSASSKSKTKEKKEDYSNKENVDLGIPSIPEPPKGKVKISADSPELSPDVLERIKKIESPDMKVVLVNCERCKAVIPIPVPKKVVLESELPIVPVSYVHKNLKNKDQHCLTIHLDHDFDIRRQRLSDVVLSND